MVKFTEEERKEWMVISDKVTKILNRDVTGEAVTKTIIEIVDLVPKELKNKKGIPTVIEYQGRRYVLDHGNK